MLPSVSYASTMNPYWPIEVLSRWMRPPAGTTRLPSTPQSSQVKYTSVLLPPEGNPGILTSDPLVPGSSIVEGNAHISMLGELSRSAPFHCSKQYFAEQAAPYAESNGQTDSGVAGRSHSLSAAGALRHREVGTEAGH